MVSKSWRMGIAPIVLLNVVLLPLSAWAALGGNAASVQADQVQMSGTLRTAAAGAYTQYEIRTPSGTVIREYVSSSGAVFAVTWEGPSLPDLRQVLGSFFDQYVQAANAQGGSAGPRLIRQPGLVVYAGGHMRAFFGKAYVPQMLPQGVSPDQIQ